MTKKEIIKRIKESGAIPKKKSLVSYPDYHNGYNRALKDVDYLKLAKVIEEMISAKDGNDYLKCQACGKSTPDVSVRACSYSSEINDTEILETICDACEHEHSMDI